MEENLNETYAWSSGLYCVETNLWLGNLAAATNIQILKEKQVKYILTVNSFPLPKNIRNLSFIEKKYIKVFDNPKDDLLSHFDETYEFIESGVKKDVVLVHCYHGISRSPTVIVSYLMKKKNMILKEALQYVKSRCELIEPNPGFLEQLKLYEIMKCTLNKTNAQYKMFRLYIILHHVRKVNALPENFADVIQDDPFIMTVNADPTVYKCRKCSHGQYLHRLSQNFSSASPKFLTDYLIFENCRRVVARGLNEIPHISSEKHSWRDSRLSKYLEKTSNYCQLMYFIEPLVWMENVSSSLEGKIICPNRTCQNKLGSFNWVSGVQCPCGTEVCPGFYLIPSKVDKQDVNMK